MAGSSGALRVGGLQTLVDAGSIVCGGNMKASPRDEQRRDWFAVITDELREVGVDWSDEAALAGRLP